MNSTLSPLRKKKHNCTFVRGLHYGRALGHQKRAGNFYVFLCICGFFSRLLFHFCNSYLDQIDHGKLIIGMCLLIPSSWLYLNNWVKVHAF